MYEAICSVVLLRSVLSFVGESLSPSLSAGKAMNFLRQSFSSSDLSTVTTPAPVPAASTHETDRTSFSDKDSDNGDDSRGIPASSLDSWRTINRIAIEDHTEVPPDEGGILIPSKCLPEEWNTMMDMGSLRALDRGFVFPGEQLHLVLYISSHESSIPEIITPFKVAAIISRANVGQEDKVDNPMGTLDSDPKNVNETGINHSNENRSDSPSNSGRTESSVLSASESLLRLEEYKKRSAALLESFEDSHFLVRIAGSDEPLWKKRSFSDYSFDEYKRDSVTKQGVTSKALETGGTIPLVLEDPQFEPKVAGGVARNAVRCLAVPNGDVMVVLQVTVSTDLKDDAVLEVLQFQHMQGHKKNNMQQLDSSLNPQPHLNDPSQQLLQWLLPLDRTPTPPPFAPLPPATSSWGSNSNRLSFAAGSNSALFSFGHSRSSSMGSVSFSSSHTITPSTILSPFSALSNGSEEWDRSISLRGYKGQDIGNEGLLSFRGALLEPQRFSVHCGLKGLYIPGKRWRRKLEIVQPIAIDSYFMDCNTEDLICVSVENIIPEHIPGVSIILDSINIICQSASYDSPPIPVPVACVEVGENQMLPGLILRPGEQHSFILKPLNPVWAFSADEKGRNGSTSLPASEWQIQNAPMRKNLPGSLSVKNGNTLLPSEGNTYAVALSCHCSHTESRLHFRHPLQWRPRTPRDLLLSITLEPPNATLSHDSNIPQLLSQVLAVQVTNLTSEDLALTLHASSLTRVNPSGLLANSDDPSAQHHSALDIKAAVVEDSENTVESSKAMPQSPSAQSPTMSLPPAKPIESIMGMAPRVVKERVISAADIAAEQSTARTHLWLQSTVPLGSVPAYSTTTVKSELLPLTDGIITLDTLYISTKNQEAMYLPERALQIYATSGITSGLV